MSTYPDYRITVLDKLDYCASMRNLESVKAHPRFSFVKGDVLSIDLVRYLLHSKHVDSVMHFAAQTHVDASFGNSLAFTMNNTYGTHVLLEACRSYGKVERFVLVSTDEVYGETSLEGGVGGRVGSRAGSRGEGTSGANGPREGDAEGGADGGGARSRSRFPVDAAGASGTALGAAADAAADLTASGSGAPATASDSGAPAATPATSSPASPPRASLADGSLTVSLAEMHLSARAPAPPSSSSSPPPPSSPIPRPVAETSRLVPTNPYAAAKAGAEMVATAYYASYGLPLIIGRGNNAYGPGQFPEKLIPKFATLATMGRPLPVHGGGLARRSYLHVADVARAYDVILHRGAVGEIYNIGSRRERTVLDVARDILHSFHLPLSRARRVRDRPFNDQRYCIDDAKLAALGWEERVPWERGLRETLEWYQRQGADGWWREDDVRRALRAHPNDDEDDLQEDWEDDVQGNEP